MMNVVYLLFQKHMIIFLLGLTGCFCVHAQNGPGSSDLQNYVTEEFLFSSKQGELALSGTFTIPKSFNSSTKIVILVAPPLPINRDYNGLFSTLANTLGNNGVAVLRFDNRAYLNQSILSVNESVTMFDQADDVHNAILKLQEDKRFINNPIGILGHSEGGCSAVIEASRNKNISFVVCLSTCGLKGVEFAYEQTSAPLVFDKRMKDGTRKCLLSHLRTYLHIVEEYNSLDSIKSRLSAAVETFYNSEKEMRFMFGDGTLEEIRQTVLREYTKPRFVDFVKYDPQKYYSKLTCPVLVMCGKMDGTQNYQKHLDGIETIFKNVGKRNFELVAVDSVNHAYKKVKQMVPLFIERMSINRNPNTPKPKFAIGVFKYISNWINHNLENNN